MTKIQKFSLLLLCLFNSLAQLNSLIFTGNVNQFAKYPIWETERFISTLSFKFRTKKENGMIFYLDDGGIDDGFICMQLVDGLIYLRYQAGRDSKKYQLEAKNFLDHIYNKNNNNQNKNQENDPDPRAEFNIKTNRLFVSDQNKIKFNDNRWHLVLVQRNGRKLRLAIDKGYNPSELDWYDTNESLSAISILSSSNNQTDTESLSEKIKTSPILNNRLPNMAFRPRTNIFFGGLPKNFGYNNLAMPSVYYAVRYNGEIEDIKIQNKILDLLGSEDVVFEETKLCTVLNPCLNGGKCRIVNNEQRCDCLDGYMGDFCEHRKYFKFFLISFY